MVQPRAELLGDLLKNVSRSFYLTLRVLPRAVRPQIGLAYLLARTSDTLADTDALPKERRLEALECFRRRILEGKGPALDLKGFSGSQSSPAERVLLERIEESLAVLAELESADRQRIQELLEIIISGQALDVQRFAQAEAAHPAALETDADLDDYTYRVAGCVGEFWTRICRAHLWSRFALDESFLLINGVRFGKGLQLVNILRDIPADLRLGRCYLPRKRLEEIGLKPADLMDHGAFPRVQRLYAEYLDRSQEHLRAGWAYTNRLPFRSVRVRLACAWPILIGVQTLNKLRGANVLDPAQRIKISRREVRSVMLRSVVLYPWPSRWSRLV
jgi:farnesyl-diphosphate farnesyltransferase